MTSFRPPRTPFNETPALPASLTPSRMNEPTRLWTIVVAGHRGHRHLVYRDRGPTSGPLRWRDMRTQTLYRWDDLTNPRPATPQETEEGRVIEP